MKLFTKTKGITLVALIITIIILLILAGIPIGQLTNNGLFENAKTAKEKYENAQKEENNILSEYEQYISGNRDYDSYSNEELIAEIERLKSQLNSISSDVKNNCNSK